MYKRGGIYTFNLSRKSDAESELCPCLVVSNNISNEFSPVVTIVPVSYNNLEKIYEFETFLPAAKTGLGRNAKVSSHILFTIDKTRVVGERIGFVSKPEMHKVAKALRLQLGL